MVTKAADLQQMKGVGTVLSKRLYEAGLDSFDKIAEAGEDELKKISGITPRNMNSIREQAGQLSKAQPAGHEERVEALQQLLSEVKEKVQTVAETTRQRFQEDLSGKSGKKLASDLARIVDVLEQMNKSGKKCSKRTSKALNKAEKRVEGLEEASLKKVRKGLKKARKAVLKVL